MRRTSVFTALLAVLFSSALLMAQADEYSAAMEDGRTAFTHRHWDEAIKDFKRATKLRSNDTAAWVALAQVYSERRSYDEAEDAAKKGLKFASADRDKAVAHGLLGYSIACQAAPGDHKKLDNAEKEFRAGLACDPANKRNQFHLGETLLRESRDQEGINILKQYLEQGAESPSYEKVALLLMQDPRRARMTFAPEFAATTIDGHSIDSTNLKGKVVLVDFWATWCPACVASIGDIQRFAKKYPADQVVVISISADNNEEKWRKFVTDHKMDWAQVFDTGGEIARSFGVRAFPSYFIVDDEGVIQRVVVGSGTFQDVVITEEIKHAMKAREKREAQSKTASSNPPRMEPASH
jgi:peroxiredoxin